MVTTLLRSLVLTAALASTFMPSTAKAEEAQAIERASGDRLSKAVGHYSRARMYLLAAIKEFDQGMRCQRMAAIGSCLAERRTDSGAGLDRCQRQGKHL